jgi:hypothetical protein
LIWVKEYVIMPKLTLNVAPRVVARAKKYAATRGTSVSKLVSAFLDAVSHPPEEGETPPVLRRLRGSLRGARLASYREYLRRKYR